MNETFPGRFLNKQNPPLKVSIWEIEGLLSEITYFVWFLNKPSVEGLHHITMSVNLFLQVNNPSRVLNKENHLVLMKKP